MKKKLISTSKFLSLILRHKPQTIGLSTDAHGWISIQAFLDAANTHNHPISRELLDEVVFTNDKKRFSYSPRTASIMEILSSVGTICES